MSRQRVVSGVVGALLALGVVGAGGPAGAGTAWEISATRPSKGLQLTFTGGLPGAGVAGSSTASTITRCGVTRPNPKDPKFTQWVLQGTATVNGTVFTLVMHLGAPAVNRVPTSPNQTGLAGAAGGFLNSPAKPFRRPGIYQAGGTGSPFLTAQLTGDQSLQVPVTRLEIHSVGGVKSTILGATGTAIEQWSLVGTGQQIGLGGTVTLKTLKTGSLNLTLGQQVVNVTDPTPGFAALPPAPPVLAVQGTFSC